MNSIQIKCYLESTSSKDSYEIRRFDLDSQNQAASIGIFQQLLGKTVVAYQGCLTELDAIKFCWEDDEKEHVGFSNDLELEYAIDYMQKKNKKKKFCFSSSSSIISLKVFVITDKSMPLNIKKISQDNNPPKKMKNKNLQKVEEIAKMARKSFSKDFNHIREHNINLLKPGYKSSESDILKSYTRTSTVHNNNPPEYLESMDDEDEKADSLNDSLREHLADNVSVTADDISQAMDSFQVSNIEIQSMKSREIDAGNLELRREIELVKNSDLDEETKADKILKINVKYYISNLLDAVCNENSDLALKK